jgi:hypothetical protein
MNQNGGQLVRKTAKHEGAAAARNFRPKGRKKHFKTELWYAAAYPKMSATNKTPSRGLEETRATALVAD